MSDATSSQGPQAASRPKTPKKRRSTLALVFVFGGAVMLTALCCLGGLYGLMAGFEVEATASDRAKIIDAAELSEHFALDFETDSDTEVFTRHRFIDGSTEIGYEYTTADQMFYISSSWSDEGDNGGAVTVYSSMALGMPIAFRAMGDGIIIDEVAIEVEGADQWTTGWMSYDGMRMGAYAILRVGQHVFSLMVTGFYVDEEELKDLLEPHIAAW